MHTILYSHHRLTDHQAEGEAITFVDKLGMGCIAGGIGSFMGVPAELSLVRMSADSKMPEELRRNYKSVVDCLAVTFKEDGVAGMWTGGTPTIIRAVLYSLLFSFTFLPFGVFRFPIRIVCCLEMVLDISMRCPLPLSLSLTRPSASACSCDLLPLYDGLQ